MRYNIVETLRRLSYELGEIEFSKRFKVMCHLGSSVEAWYITACFGDDIYGVPATDGIDSYGNSEDVIPFGNCPWIDPTKLDAPELIDHLERVLKPQTTKKD